MATIVRFPIRTRRHWGPPERLAASPEVERDLLAIGLVLWLASVARVAVALVEHEVFGIEATLALLCVASLPWLLRRERRVDGPPPTAESKRPLREDTPGELIPFPAMQRRRP